VKCVGGASQMKGYNKEKNPPGKQHGTRLLRNVNDRLLRKERGIE
jgi:hypothetical protein